MNKKHKTTEKGRLIGIASLLFQQAIPYKISRLLGNFNIKTVQIPAEKSSHIIRSVTVVFHASVEECI
jgi:hypothetical protein